VNKKSTRAKAKIELNKAKINWAKFLGYKALASMKHRVDLHFFSCNIVRLKELALPYLKCPCLVVGEKFFAN
jgi:hypothetical protein